MSRSGYTDYHDSDWSLICWRGAVASAICGRRGQAFLKEMAEALDALLTKRLIRNELETDGEVCAIGAVGLRRGTTMADIDPEDNEKIAERFGIARAMACEIMWENDECGWRETPEERFNRMRDWVQRHIKT